MKSIRNDSQNDNTQYAMWDKQMDDFNDKNIPRCIKRRENIDVKSIQVSSELADFLII